MTTYEVVYRINKKGVPVHWKQEAIVAATLYDATDKFWTFVEKFNIEGIDYVWFRREKK